MNEHEQSRGLLTFAIEVADIEVPLTTIGITSEPKQLLTSNPLEVIDVHRSAAELDPAFSVELSAPGIVVAVWHPDFYITWEVGRTEVLSQRANRQEEQ